MAERQKYVVKVIRITPEVVYATGRVEAMRKAEAKVAARQLNALLVVAGAVRGPLPDDDDG